MEQAQKDKIREEEAYRIQLREKMGSKVIPQPAKKGIGCLGWFLIIFIGFPVLISMILIAINPSKQMEDVKKVAEEYQKGNKQYAFDVPSLVGKDLDGVIAILGEPRGQDPTSLQIQQGVIDWDKTFIKDGKELLVTYTISNRKIIDFFISTDDPSGGTSDSEALLLLGNLKQTDSRYRVEFVKAIGSPGSFTGVKVIPSL